MRPTPDTATAARIHLRAGQTYRLWSGRDAMILMLAGHIRAQSAASWNPHCLPVWQTSLRAEEHCVLTACGWLYLTAEQDCELLYYAAPRAGMLSLALLRRLLAGPVRRAWRVWQMRQSRAGSQQF